MAEPTRGQRRLMYALFAFAFLMTLLGIVAVVVLSNVL
jgi:hypothetical protein